MTDIKRHEWRPTVNGVACKNCGYEPPEQRCFQCGQMIRESTVSHGSLFGGICTYQMKQTECPGEPATS